LSLFPYTTLFRSLIGSLSVVNEKRKSGTGPPVLARRLTACRTVSAFYAAYRGSGPAPVRPWSGCRGYISSRFPAAGLPPRTGPCRKYPLRTDHPADQSSSAVLFPHCHAGFAWVLTGRAEIAAGLLNRSQCQPSFYR